MATLRNFCKGHGLTSLDFNKSKDSKRLFMDFYHNGIRKPLVTKEGMAFDEIKMDSNVYECQAESELGPVTVYVISNKGPEKAGTITIE